MEPFAHTNTKGKTYYLHQNGRLFYFASTKQGGIDLPAGYKVVESEKTNLPMLKKRDD
ncbi:MAG: hypothetical protein AABX02_02720 [archaeon]